MNDLIYPLTVCVQCSENVIWDAELKCRPFSILNFLRSIYNSKFGRIRINKSSSLNYKELEFRFKTNSEKEWNSVASGMHQFPHNMKLKQTFRADFFQTWQLEAVLTSVPRIPQSACFWPNLEKNVLEHIKF